MPKGHTRKPKYTGKAAREYPFKLDPFQQTAVNCLEMGESVLVAAHTSAGKTAVAEYAIAMALRDKQRVVYTSPIKALSNQKYRELDETFGDVGLITGDVTINPNNSCLVMTTEILRSMLYRGSEIVREVAWVIFDEVHYMRDKERGVIWEETMILLGENVRYVFLSATIPNAREFAEWICRIKKQPCHVVYTDFRPVPLQHYIFPSGGSGLYLTVDEKGEFREDNFAKALSSLADAADPFATDKRKKKKPTEGADLYKILKLIVDRSLDPVIIFSFSKKEVEAFATAMHKFDLTNDDEKDSINEIFTSAIGCLSEEDRKLPQIQEVLPILKRGIGIHHGGLLPIVKEVTEILFQDGYIKCLFSTETFSMGLNMPARTVVFTSVRKFDGENFRWIGGGEYIQMSGRAGRRGLDDKGVTILMIDEKMEPEVAKGMLKGQADSLYSSFHLSYNMLLNALRIEDHEPEYIIRRSFHQFQSDKSLPEMKVKLQEITEKRKECNIQDEEKISEIYKLNQQIKLYKEKIRKITCQPQYLLPFFAIGRLVYVKNGETEWGWGVVINFTKKKVQVKRKKQPQPEEENDETYIVDTFLHMKKRKKNEEPTPAGYNEEGEMEVMAMILDSIAEVSSVRINLPNDLTRADHKLMVKETLKEIVATYKGNLPLIDPIVDMKINDESLVKAIGKKGKLEKSKQELENHFDAETLKKEMTTYEQMLKYDKSIGVLKNQIQECNKMVLQDDLKCMKGVLRRLNFIDKQEIVQLKGRVACEISACDEIIGTELMFTGVFNEMSPSEIAALMSCLVYDERSDDQNANLKNERLIQAFDILLDNAKRILQVYQKAKINIDETEYLGGFNPKLMEATYAWCNGSSFLEICKMANTYEGSIIRCLRRLDELLRQLSEAAKSIGNTELEEKFKKASKSMKKGIVFAGSLYI